VSLTEEEIRPERLREGQAERFAEDVRRLLEKQDSFVEVPCPACGGGAAGVAFVKVGFSYRRCGDCWTLFISPRPTPAILKEYYATSENYEYWNRYIFPATEAARREKIFRPRVSRLEEICDHYEVPRGILLEVGAGFGTFCEEVRRRGRFERVLAVEPTPSLADTCRKRGLEVIEKPIEDVRLEGAKVDVIASFEVIEHLFSPKHFLDDCAAVLRPGGLLVLSCPNVDGFEISILGAASDSVDAEHLNYFNPASLSRLAETSGFKILEVTTPGELDAELVQKKVISGAIDISNRPFLRRVLIEDWNRTRAPFQRFLSESGLSSHMWLVGRRDAG
jgi:2-polyprenyl-3-methyl-5-hydroxy-6-metoxy-1,4-benzoquinol methylase